MMRRRTTILAQLLLVGWVVPVAVQGQTTWYVDNDASTGGDGTTWSTAYKYLQDALALATAGDDVRVAQGTYKPDQDEAGNVLAGDRLATFQLPSGVTLRGSYAGYGAPDPNERDIETYPTILTGDIGTPGASGDNSYHVVRTSNAWSIIVDGLVITEGNANGGGWENSGGGMHNQGGTIAIVNCTFRANSASSNGGGIMNYASSGCTFVNCTFTGNSASQGGGMFNYISGAGVTNCTFSGNTAGFGGAISNAISSPAVTNCVLWGNSLPQVYTSSGTPVVNYSIVQGGWSGAGGIGVLDADPLFVDPDGPDDIPGTDDDNLRLLPGSPSIDAGNNAAVPADTADLDGDGDTTEQTPFDLDGNPRFVDDPDADDCPQPGADCGTPPIVDMGAYEYQGGGEPIPTVSEWGMAVMTLLLLTAGTLLFMRRWAGRAGVRFPIVS